MGSLVPVHPPLSAPPPAFECPEDTTEFFELTDDELRCLWEAFDADGDGTLDADELPVGRISLGDLKGLGGGGG